MPESTDRQKPPKKGFTVAGVPYVEYIQSDEWRRMRERYWASGAPTDCYICDRPRHPGMHLHHRSYQRLGAERVDDLVPVCEECHAFIHEYQKSTGQTLRQATRNARIAWRKNYQQKEPKKPRQRKRKPIRRNIQHYGVMSLDSDVKPRQRKRPVPVKNCPGCMQIMYTDAYKCERCSSADGSVRPSDTVKKLKAARKASI